LLSPVDPPPDEGQAPNNGLPDPWTGEVAK
jgi:hypothetical protein